MSESGISTSHGLRYGLYLSTWINVEEIHYPSPMAVQRSRIASDVLDRELQARDPPNTAAHFSLLHHAQSLAAQATTDTRTSQTKSALTLFGGFSIFTPNTECIPEA